MTHRAAGHWIPAYAGMTTLLPPHEIAQRAAHHELEVLAFEPWQLFGEHRHALFPRARHARDVGAPEHALRPESVEDLLQVFVDVAVGVRLARVARRAGGLDGDVRVFREREELP